MSRWIILGWVLLSQSGCEWRGLDDDNDEPPAPVVVPVDGEPLGGSISATWEGQPVSFHYGVALPLNASVELGVVDVWISTLPIDCAFNIQDGDNNKVKVELPAPEPGTYDEAWIEFRRDAQARHTNRGSHGVLELAQHDSETVAGTISWDHTDMTDIRGDFVVKRCDQAVPY